MEVKWDVDSVDCGRIVYRPGINERWFIGYIVQDLISVKGNTYCLVSTADGLICRVGSKNDMAVHLTTHGYLPYEVKQYKQINEWLPK